MGGVWPFPFSTENSHCRIFPPLYFWFLLLLLLLSLLLVLCVPGMSIRSQLGADKLLPTPMGNLGGYFQKTRPFFEQFRRLQGKYFFVKAQNAAVLDFYQRVGEWSECTTAATNEKAKKRLSVRERHCHVFLGGLDAGQAPLKTLLLMLRLT